MTRKLAGQFEQPKAAGFLTTRVVLLVYRAGRWPTFCSGLSVKQNVRLNGRKFKFPGQLHRKHHIQTHNILQNFQLWESLSEWQNYSRKANCKMSNAKENISKRFPRPPMVNSVIRVRHCFARRRFGVRRPPEPKTFAAGAASASAAGRTADVYALQKGESRKRRRRGPRHVGRSLLSGC